MENSTYANNTPYKITAEELIKTIQKLEETMPKFHPLYYATSQIVNQGKIIHLPENDYNYESIIINPDDLHLFKKYIGKELKHISEAPIKILPFDTNLKKIIDFPHKLSDIYSI